VSTEVKRVKKTLHIVYSDLPPTSNKLYFKGTRLTQAARQFKAAFCQYVIQNYLHEIGSFVNPDPTSIYGVYLRFFFESLVNDTFNDPKIPASKRAKTRYKRIDLSNRIKLLEDCIQEVLAVDDCRTFRAGQEKFQDSFYPRVEIFITELDPMEFGIK